MWYIVVCSGIAVNGRYVDGKKVRTMDSRSVVIADLRSTTLLLSKIVRHGRINGQKGFHVHGAKVKVPAEIGSR